MQVPGVSELRKLIRDVPDFPKPGILFKDITPLLADTAALKEAARVYLRDGGRRGTLRRVCPDPQAREAASRG